MLAGEPAPLRLLARGRAHEIRQAGQVILAPEFEYVGLLVREYVLGKGCAEPGKPLDDLAEAFFRVNVEGRARPPEARAIALEQARLLEGEAERLTPAP